jgi:transposase
MDVLNLEEFEVLEMHESEEYYKFVAKSDLEEPYFCSHCMASPKDITQAVFKLHDTRKRTVADVDYRGKKVIIEVLQRRYNCSDCGKRFPEFFSEVSRNDKVTNRLWIEMGKQSLSSKNTFSSLAEKYGVSVMTVKRAFTQYVQELDRKRVLIAPRVLGIDEVYINLGEPRKVPCAVFTDIENNQIIEFVVGNTKELVIQIIKKMQGYENIEVVTMDMNSGYRHAINETIPKAYCVVDRFHVIQKANMVLDVMRAGIQSKLKEGDKKELFKVKDLIRGNRENLEQHKIIILDFVLEKYPRLKTAYWLKENLRLIYKCESKYDAFKAYYEWETSIPKDAKEMKGIQRMINRIKQEVFAYFDGRWTNAFTESFNNIIKRIVRLGNGYSYDVLRAKIIYGTEATKITKVKDMQFTRLFDMHQVQFMDNEYTEEDVYKDSYRVDINELLLVINKGEF